MKGLAGSPQKARANAAKAALAAKNRWDLDGPRGLELAKPFAERLRVIPEGWPLPPEAIERIGGTYMCARGACAAVWLDDDRIGVLGQNAPGEDINFDFVTRNAEGRWVQGDRASGVSPKGEADLSKAKIGVEAVQQRRIMVDGVAESGTFE